MATFLKWRLFQNGEFFKIANFSKWRNFQNGDFFNKNVVRAGAIA
jgi:hypothetical protein